jgi:hypothetical protein
MAESFLPWFSVYMDARFGGAQTGIAAVEVWLALTQRHLVSSEVCGRGVRKENPSTTGD